MGRGRSVRRGIEFEEDGLLGHSCLLPWSKGDLLTVLIHSVMVLATCPSNSQLLPSNPRPLRARNAAATVIPVVCCSASLPARPRCGDSTL